LASLLAATIQDQSIWGLVNALDRCMDLAKDGFYYLGPHDKVRCVFCNLEVYKWEIMDQVHEEHMKFNSKCPLHSLGPSSTGNVCIGEEQTGEVSTDAVVFAEMSESKFLF
jgi:Inhibitor of Apoptosis domain